MEMATVTATMPRVEADCLARRHTVCFYSPVRNSVNNDKRIVVGRYKPGSRPLLFGSETQLILWQFELAAVQVFAKVDRQFLSGLCIIYAPCLDIVKDIACDAELNGHVAKQVKGVTTFHQSFVRN